MQPGVFLQSSGCAQHFETYEEEETEEEDEGDRVVTSGL